jgi:hypothetical protein
MHHGASLTSVAVRFRVTVARTSLPATQPQAIFSRADAAGAFTALATSTLSAVNADAYFNGGKPQGLALASFAGGLPHTVDVSTNTYLLDWVDETGANAMAGNLIHSVVLTFSVSDMRSQ